MSRDEKNAVVCDWFLEYTCHDMWQKFTAGSDIDQGSEDLAKGVLSMQKSCWNEATQGKEVAFLSLTFCLISLRNNMPEATTDRPEEIYQDLFEHILKIMNCLTSLCHTDTIAEKAAEARKKTLVQKLLACCRQNKYELAEELFEEESGDMDKETCRKIQAILTAKKKPHRFLEEDTLTDYVATMTQFLDAVYCTFPAQPVVEQLAGYFLENGTRYKGASGSHSRQEIQEGLDEIIGAQKLNSKEERALNKKLQAVRQEKFKAAALSVANTNNNGGISDESDSAADNDTQRSNSSQKRKRSGGSRPARQRSRSASPKKASKSLAVEEISSSESGDEKNLSGNETDMSLGSRVTLNVRPFHMRESLAPSSVRKPPSHSKTYVGRMMWTKREEEEFYLAVQQHGVGQWKSIRMVLKTDRSSVQLKDKWRNICKAGYLEMCKKFGPVE